TPTPDTASGLNKDLADTFGKYRDDFQAPYTPESARDAFTNPATVNQLRDDLTDVFTKHLGPHTGRDLADTYTTALTKNWGKPTLGDDIAAALGPNINPTLRDHLAHTVPTTLNKNLAELLAKPGARAEFLALSAAAGAIEGYVGEGLTNLAFTDKGFDANWWSATAGA
ncbi:hypothetical protein, partial [Streptomonospora sediminis]